MGDWVGSKEGVERLKARWRLMLASRASLFVHRHPIEVAPSRNRLARRCCALWFPGDDAVELFDATPVLAPEALLITKGRTMATSTVHPNHQLISSEDVEDTDVYDMKRNKIGDIDHLMIDKV